MAKCTLEKCLTDNRMDVMKCGKCKRRVHHSCSMLPKYQIVMFTTAGYSEFCCVNCVANNNIDYQIIIDQSV